MRETAMRLEKRKNMVFFVENKLDVFGPKQNREGREEGMNFEAVG